MFGSGYLGSGTEVYSGSEGSSEGAAGGVVEHIVSDDNGSNEVYEHDQMSEFVYQKLGRSEAQIAEDAQLDWD